MEYGIDFDLRNDDPSTRTVSPLKTGCTDICCLGFPVLLGRDPQADHVADHGCLAMSNSLSITQRWFPRILCMEKERIHSDGYAQNGRSLGKVAFKVIKFLPAPPKLASIAHHALGSPSCFRSSHPMRSSSPIRSHW